MATHSSVLAEDPDLTRPDPTGPDLTRATPRSRARDDPSNLLQPGGSQSSLQSPKWLLMVYHL